MRDFIHKMTKDAYIRYQQAQEKALREGLRDELYEWLEEEARSK